MEFQNAFRPADGTTVLYRPDRAPRPNEIKIGILGYAYSKTIKLVDGAKVAGMSWPVMVMAQQSDRHEFLSFAARIERVDGLYVASGSFDDINGVGSTQDAALRDLLDNLEEEYASLEVAEARPDDPRVEPDADLLARLRQVMRRKPGQPRPTGSAFDAVIALADRQISEGKTSDLLNEFGHLNQPSA
jgi:hypothetical protein